jgi:hypothetical protein
MSYPGTRPASFRRRQKAAIHTIDVAALQRFATDMRKVLSHKTVVNIIGTVFPILHYAAKTGCPVPKVSFADLTLGEPNQSEAPYFTEEQAPESSKLRENLTGPCLGSCGVLV